MKNKIVFVFFDEVMQDYERLFGQDNIAAIVEDMKEALEKTSATHKIALITKQDVVKTEDWLRKNGLFCFIDSIANPQIL